MDAKEAIQYLSHNLNQDKKLQKFILDSGFDFKKALSVENEYDDKIIYKDSGALYLTNKKKGYDFLLKTENTFFCNKLHLPMIEGDWYFNTIFLNSEGAEDGYGQYEGELPHGLSFDMTKSEIHAILGDELVFSRSNKYNAIVGEKWEFDYYTIYVNYHKDGIFPRVISFSTYNASFPPKKEGIKVRLPEALCDLENKDKI